MNNLPEINYRGLEDYINNYSLKNEINEFNNLINNINVNNIPIRLIPPHNFTCSNNNCKKMAIFIINKKYECFWHYYMNDDYN
jgi:hypothetical protein